MLSYIIIATVTFVFMEGVAWFAHKYVMHGFLWRLHKDHHYPVKERGHSFFEMNDWFFVIFAFPSMIGYMLGSYLKNPYLLSIAIGITIYGAAYFIFHEVVFHRRLKWFKRWKPTYVRSVILAHSMHHRHHSQEEGECFGLLIFPIKYYQAEKAKSKLKK